MANLCVRSIACSGRFRVRPLTCAWRASSTRASRRCRTASTASPTDLPPGRAPARLRGPDPALRPPRGGDRRPQRGRVPRRRPRRLLIQRFPANWPHGPTHRCRRRLPARFRRERAAAEDRSDALRGHPALPIRRARRTRRTQERVHRDDQPRGRDRPRAAHGDRPFPGGRDDREPRAALPVLRASHSGRPDRAGDRAPRHVERVLRPLLDGWKASRRRGRRRRARSAWWTSSHASRRPRPPSRASSRRSRRTRTDALPTRCPRVSSPSTASPRSGIRRSSREVAEAAPELRAALSPWPGCTRCCRRGRP